MKQVIEMPEVLGCAARGCAYNVNSACHARGITVVLAYWKRHCPGALKRGDVEVLSRVHNGGPRGHRKRITASYWHAIRAVSARPGRTPQAR
jgi:hypothetical protein